MERVYVYRSSTESLTSADESQDPSYLLKDEVIKELQEALKKVKETQDNPTR